MNDTGRRPSLWKLGGLTPFGLAKRVWRNLSTDEVSVRATSLAYYFVLALFPALLFLLTILGFFATTGSQLQQNLFSQLARLLPQSASQLVQTTLQQVSAGRGAGIAVFGILGALWSASSGVAAIMQSLNVAYHVDERRSWLKRQVVAVVLTLALAVLVLAALGLALFGGKAADFLGSRGLGAVAVTSWHVVQWPIVLLFMFVAFAITYYFGPDLENPEWHWITPGAVTGLFLWLVASFGLKVYLHFFNSYNKMYGSLGAVIILLLWLYMTGFCIMLGGEVNSEIGRATDKQLEEAERARVIHPEPRAA